MWRFSDSKYRTLSFVSFIASVILFNRTIHPWWNFEWRQKDWQSYPVSTTFHFLSSFDLAVMRIPMTDLHSFPFNCSVILSRMHCLLFQRSNSERGPAFGSEDLHGQITLQLRRQYFWTWRHSKRMKPFIRVIMQDGVNGWYPTR